MWIYNEFLFFYEKEPYKQFIWRYMGQTIQIIATTSFQPSVDSLVELIFSAAKECAFSFCWGITNHKWLIDFLTFTTT